MAKKMTGIYRSSFPCKQGCARSFKTESERSRHNAVTHQMESKCQLPTTGETLTLRRDPSTGEFSCPLCKDFASPDPGDVRSHCKSCEALPYGGLAAISSAGWTADDGRAPAATGADAAGTRSADGWSSTVSHKTLPGHKHPSASAPPAHSTKSPGYALPSHVVPRAAQHQVVYSASVPPLLAQHHSHGHATKRPTASTAPGATHEAGPSFESARDLARRSSASLAGGNAGASGSRASPFASSSSSSSAAPRAGRPSSPLASTSAARHPGRILSSTPSSARSASRERERTHTGDAQRIPIVRGSTPSHASERRVGSSGWQAIDRPAYNAAAGRDDGNSDSDASDGVIIMDDSSDPPTPARAPVGRSPVSARNVGSTASQQQQQKQKQKSSQQAPTRPSASPVPPRPAQPPSPVAVARAAPLKRKQTSSLPTPATASRSAPKRARRESLATTASGDLGTDDDLWGSDVDAGAEADDEEAGPAVGEAFDARVTSRREPLGGPTASYPSPEPSGSDEGVVVSARGSQVGGGPGLREERATGAGREQQAALLPFLEALARQHAAQQPDGDDCGDAAAHEPIEGDDGAGFAELSRTDDDENGNDPSGGMDFEPDFGALTAGSGTNDGGDTKLADRDADTDDDKEEPPDDDAEMESVDVAVAPVSSAGRSPAARRSPSFRPASPTAHVVPLSTPANAPSRPAASPTPSSSSASTVGKRPAAVGLSQGSPTPVHGTRSSDEAAATRASATTALSAQLSQATEPFSLRRSPSSVSLSQAEAVPPSGPSQPLMQPMVARQAVADRWSSSSAAPSRPSSMRSALEPSAVAVGPQSSTSSSPATNAAGAGLSASQVPLDAIEASSPAQAIPSAQAQTRTAVDGSEPQAPSSSASGPLQVQITSPAGASSSQAARLDASADRPSSGNSSNPIVVGTGLRRTPPPPPIVHSSQSAAAAGPSQPPRPRPRVFPHQMTPWFYYQTSIRNLLRPDEPPYDRLRKLAIRVELLLGWRPLLIERLERVADGKPTSGAALDPVVQRALKDTLSLLRTDEQNADVVDFVREWLVKSQLAIDPSSVNDASFRQLVRDLFSSSTAGSTPSPAERRVAAAAAAVFEFILIHWKGTVDDLPEGLRTANLTFADPTAPLSAARAFINPAPWALVKVVVGPPCERVAGAWRLLKDFGLWELEVDEVDGESSQEGLVDDDAMETGC